MSELSWNDWIIIITLLFVVSSIQSFFDSFIRITNTDKYFFVVSPVYSRNTMVAEETDGLNPDIDWTLKLMFKLSTQ